MAAMPKSQLLRRRRPEALSRIVIARLILQDAISKYLRACGAGLSRWLYPHDVILF
jgi:hypothetical protein